MTDDLPKRNREEPTRLQEDQADDDPDRVYEREIERCGPPEEAG